MICVQSTSRNTEATLLKFPELISQAFDSDINLEDMHLVDF